MKCREAVSEAASPAALSSTKPGRTAWRSTEEGAWIDRPGYDAGKKIKGENRHILVDTQGLLIPCHRACRRYSGPRWRRTGHDDHVRPVSVLAETLRRSGCRGPVFRHAVTKILTHVNVESSSARITPQALWTPGSWVVDEPSHDSPSRGSRRIAESLDRRALTFLRLAFRLMLRRLCNPG